MDFPVDLERLSWMQLSVLRLSLSPQWMKRLYTTPLFVARQAGQADESQELFAAIHYILLFMMLSQSSTFK
jgi:hypothetical protein